MLKIVRDIFMLLTPSERRTGLLLLGMILIMAFMETAGVASVMPFLAVLGNPDIVQENAFLSWLYETGGFADTAAFVFALGVGALAFMVFAAVWRMLTKLSTAYYIQMRGHYLSARLLSAYLHQPYEFFLGRNSADLSKAVLSEVQMFLNGVLRPVMQLVTYALVSVTLLVFLLLVDYVVALVAAAIILGFYSAVYLSIRGLTERNGRARVAAYRLRFTVASEALGGIKEVKVFGLESAYLDRFIEPSERQARYQALNAALSQIPRFVIEIVAFGGIILLTLFLMSTSDSLGEVLPVLGLYAFAGYRLLPALQTVYASLVQLRFGMPTARVLGADMTERERDRIESHRVSAESRVAPRESIRLEDVSFRYRGAREEALKHIDLEIPVNTSVGIVGETGAGKSTLVDLVLGLVEPTGGRLFVDGRPLHDVGVGRWQAALGYVPQHIYLADDTIAANIAFGCAPDEIDRERGERAARLASLHDFIVSQLQDGYEAVVGERGVRLSGGQRQRIGIARALYRDPDVLLFDEATSALDNRTEADVMDAVSRLRGSKTLIIIAHRLSTVRDCDQILYLERGQVVGKGSFDGLYAENQGFREFVGEAM